MLTSSWSGRPNAFLRILCTCVLALFLLACGDTEAPAAPRPPAETPAPTGGTNIRLAKRTPGGPFVEGDRFVRDGDHVEQIMPPIYQMEGPAWENENVGFRLYFDRRNGLDIFGKKTRDMVLDTVGVGGNYHELADWGMDVLKVGNSLGAGGIGFLVDGQAYRLGDAREETVRILSESDAGSSFVVEYRGLPLADRMLDLDWQFDIAPGTHHYTATVVATGLRGGEELLVGIVNLHSDTLYTEQRGGRTIGYTYGPQAELDALLGMALSVPADQVSGRGAFGPDEQPISSTYYFKFPLENDAPVRYQFTAGWAPRHPAFATREGFAAVIR